MERREEMDKGKREIGVQRKEGERGYWWWRKMDVREGLDVEERKVLGILL